MSVRVNSCFVSPLIQTLSQVALCRCYEYNVIMYNFHDMFVWKYSSEYVQCPLSVFQAPYTICHMASCDIISFLSVLELEV